MTLEEQIDIIVAEVTAKINEMKTNPNASPILVITLQNPSRPPFPSIAPIIQHVMPVMPTIVKK